MIDARTAFFVGPPAAGKSTIALAVAERLNRTFRTIDEWTMPAASMTDLEVDRALGLLFAAIKPTNEVVEFCHHSYETLIEGDVYPVFTSAPKVVVIAPLTVCLARNQLRRSPVQPEYVARAWRSSERLVRYAAAHDPDRTVVIDSSRHSVEAAVAEVVDFLTIEWRSQ